MSSAAESKPATAGPEAVAEPAAAVVPPPGAAAAGAATTGAGVSGAAASSSSSLMMTDMNKYKKVIRPRETTPDDEIRVTNMGRVTQYVSYAAKLFREQNKSTITIRASGLAIPVAISTVEVLKRRFEGLHQVTTTGLSQLIDEYEGKEEGLEKRTRTRHVPFISVLLSTDESAVDKRAPGYQAPIDPSLVKELRDFSTEPPRNAEGGGGGDRQQHSSRGRGGRGGRGGGRGGRGRGGRGGFGSRGGRFNGDRGDRRRSQSPSPPSAGGNNNNNNNDNRMEQSLA